MTPDQSWLESAQRKIEEFGNTPLEFCSSVPITEGSHGFLRFIYNYDSNLTDIKSVSCQVYDNQAGKKGWEQDSYGWQGCRSKEKVLFVCKPDEILNQKVNLFDGVGLYASDSCYSRMLDNRPEFGSYIPKVSDFHKKWVKGRLEWLNDIIPDLIAKNNQDCYQKAALFSELVKERLSIAQSLINDRVYRTASIWDPVKNRECTVKEINFSPSNSNTYVIFDGPIGAVSYNWMMERGMRSLS